MRYTLLGVVIVLAVCAFVFYAAAAVRRSVKARQVERRDRARRRATWEDVVVSKDGKTQVLVQRVARDGNWSEVIDQQFVGLIHDDREDFDAQLDAMWTQAKKRVYQLNTGPLM